jgi:asparagine synthase (glutamine-hydrolysing)
LRHPRLLDQLEIRAARDWHLMCGIVGIAFPDRRRTIDLRAAVKSLGHRGPDAAGTLETGQCALGHTRLAVIDLSEGGAQPMTSEDGRVELIFNGEIYNHRSIREALEAKGVVFRSRSDTEAILHGYRVWGPDVVSRLDGMFALAIFDVEQQMLLLARDRAGKKPLFYRYDGGELRFASEPKAIFASGVPAELDPNSLPMLLAFGYVPSPWSIHRGVAQLPPASTLLLRLGSEPRIQRYWQPRFSERPISVSVEKAASDVRQLVIEAVRRRLESDVPLGAFLSGGLDSTIVVGVMSRLLGQKVKTFSLGFAGDARYDETAYARQAARAFETQHEEFIVQPASLDVLDTLVRAHDGPFGDSSAIPTSIVSRLARNHVTVALTGDGGDELFCGYNRLLVIEALERVPRGAGRIARRIRALLPRSGSERSTVGRARRLLALVGEPLPRKLADSYPYFGIQLERILRPEYLSGRSALDWTDSLLLRSKERSPLARALDHCFQTYLPDDLLVKADRSSMMHSLELRSPLLDTALVEYASSLPDVCRRHGVTKKYVLRRAFADIVPQTILQRPKMGFGVPLGTWFRSGARTFIQERLGAGAKLFQFIEPAFVSTMLREHQASHDDHGHRLWLLLTLETWLNQLPG